MAKILDQIYVMPTVKWFAFLISTCLAHGLPTFQEARDLLLASSYEERDTFTKELWLAGTEARPLLEKLVKDNEPEIQHRARFVLQHIKMGLTPESDPAILGLINELQAVAPSRRQSFLEELIEFPHGVPAAFHLLNFWSEDPDEENDLLFKLSRPLISDFFEHRHCWEEVLSIDFSPRCRAIFCAALLPQGLPREDTVVSARMVEILAKGNPNEIFKTVEISFGAASLDLRLSLARCAILDQKPLQALQILNGGLLQDQDLKLARAYVFLESSLGVAPELVESEIHNDLEILRARAAQDHEQVAKLAKEATEGSLFQYESRLLANILVLPDRKESENPLNSQALSALHQSFDERPGNPDIEALSSNFEIDSTVLIRTLVLLDRPQEAVDVLVREERFATAVRLLWRTGNHEDAIQLAETFIADNEGNVGDLVRLTLARLFLEAGQLDDSRQAFAPLFSKPPMRSDQLRIALRISAQIYPLKKTLRLVPGIEDESIYKQTEIATYLLPFPEKLTRFWFLQISQSKPQKTMIERLEIVRDFIENRPPEAHDALVLYRKTSGLRDKLPSSPFFQAALQMKSPFILELAIQAAWYQLDSSILQQIAEDPDWPLFTRAVALTEALKISPCDPVLQWLAGSENSKKAAALLILGSARQSQRIASRTKKLSHLQLAAELSDLSDRNSYLVLASVAQAKLSNGEKKDAARLLRTALLGEIASGFQPATPMGETIEQRDLWQEAVHR